MDTEAARAAFEAAEQLRQACGAPRFGTITVVVHAGRVEQIDAGRRMRRADVDQLREGGR